MMTKQKLGKRLVIIIFTFGTFLPLSHAFAGTILNAYKYAWSNQVGYINFAPANGGVIVTDSALSGYAWSENTGYINFAPAQGGVLNDGHGNLSGYAWGEGIGYINFNGVTIGPPIGGTRKFSGTANGPLIGTLTFDCAFCDVRTDWQPTPITSSQTTSGGGRLINTTLNPTTNETVSTKTEESPTCPIYMYKYIKLGFDNDPKEVEKLQIFLRDYEDFNNLSVSGIYDQITYEAVKQFQAKYAGDVLSPWGSIKPTGYVFKTTIKKINEIYCEFSPSKNNFISGNNEPTNNSTAVPSSPGAEKNGAVNGPAKMPIPQNNIFVSGLQSLGSFLKRIIDFMVSTVSKF